MGKNQWLTNFKWVLKFFSDHYSLMHFQFFAFGDVPFPGARERRSSVSGSPQFGFLDLLLRHIASSSSSRSNPSSINVFTLSVNLRFTFLSLLCFGVPLYPRVSGLFFERTVRFENALCSITFKCAWATQTVKIILAIYSL